MIYFSFSFRFDVYNLTWCITLRIPGTETRYDIETRVDPWPQFQSFFFLDRPFPARDPEIVFLPILEEDPCAASINSPPWPWSTSDFRVFQNNDRFSLSLSLVLLVDFNSFFCNFLLDCPSFLSVLSLAFFLLFPFFFFFFGC